MAEKEKEEGPMCCPAAGDSTVPVVYPASGSSISPNTQEDPAADGMPGKGFVLGVLPLMPALSCFPAKWEAGPSDERVSEKSRPYNGMRAIRRQQLSTKGGQWTG